MPRRDASSSPSRPRRSPPSSSLVSDGVPSLPPSFPSSLPQTSPSIVPASTPSTPPTPQSSFKLTGEEIQLLRRLTSMRLSELSEGAHPRTPTEFATLQSIYTVLLGADPSVHLFDCRQLELESYDHPTT